ncbi:MAG: glutamate/aspartate ABC transporter substrate-binding protein [Magnetococcales bacterium]|nr:glutamate/aspartate ABC transporter substrate-binding protein [Magnetococcales bacterium]
MSHSFGRLYRIALGLLALLLPQGALASDAVPTLEKIRQSGSISLGHRESSIPFSYYDDKQQVIGYSHDVMMKVVAAIQAELKLERLEVRLMPVTSANRITLVQNGTIDLECGSTTNNLERQKQVAFSNSLFIVSTRLMTRRDGGVTDFADLAGKNVVTTAGTTSERLLRRMNEDKKMAMNIISAKDHGESFLTLETGRAVAFMMDDALLYGELAKAKNPALWTITGTAQSHEAYGCMMRRDDPGFKQVVDRAIAQLMQSEAMVPLYNKWFLQPIPPKGLNLNFPLSPDVQQLFQNPNDRAFE